MRRSRTCIEGTAILGDGRGRTHRQAGEAVRREGGAGPYFPDFTNSSAISRSLNFCTFIDGVMGKSSTKNTRLGTL